MAQCVLVITLRMPREGPHRCLGTSAAAAFTLRVNPGPSRSRCQGEMKCAQALLGELPCGGKWRKLGKAREPADPDASPSQVKERERSLGGSIVHAGQSRKVRQSFWGILEPKSKKMFLMVQSLF